MILLRCFFIFWFCLSTIYWLRIQDRNCFLIFFLWGNLVLMTRFTDLHGLTQVFFFKLFFLIFILQHLVDWESSILIYFLLFLKGLSRFHNPGRGFYRLIKVNPNLYDISSPIYIDTHTPDKSRNKKNFNYKQRVQYVALLYMRMI